MNTNDITVSTKQFSKGFSSLGMKSSFLSLNDISKNIFLDLIKGGLDIKQRPEAYSRSLLGKNVALLFQKTSTRTRVSFEFGVQEMGGNVAYIDWNTSNFVLASIADEAKTLSKYCDLIVARLNKHENLEEMNKACEVPIINGLTDMYHPCQALGDFITISEQVGSISDVTIAYIGDGNNVCHSLVNAAGLSGAKMIVCAPDGYQLPKSVIDSAINRNVDLELVSSPVEAVKFADVIYTDTWVSIGQEDESAKRMEAFKKYQINDSLLKNATKDFCFMHCLPAHRGNEVTDSVIDAEYSVVFSQAENRKHAQKYLMHRFFSD